MDAARCEVAPGQLGNIRCQRQRGAIGGAGEAALHADPLGGERGHRQALDQRVGGAVPLLQIFGKRDVQRDLRRGDRDRLSAAAIHGRAAQRPRQPRAHIAHREFAVESDSRPAAIGSGDMRGHEREGSRKIAAQIAAAVQRRADIAPRRFEPRPRVAQPDRHVGQCERTLVGRVAKFIERAERQLPIDEAAVEPQAVGAHRCDIGPRQTKPD